MDDLSMFLGAVGLLIFLLIWAKLNEKEGR
jgi:hypothetical protein